MNIYGTINNDSIFGTVDDDRLSGNYGDDSLYGDFGNDFLIAGAGSDTIVDEWGENRLYGGSGNDVIVGVGKLYGGDGEDKLLNSFQGHSIETGGRGADIFITTFNSNPYIPETLPPTVVIKDFHPSQGDKLVLQGFGPEGQFYGADGFGNGTRLDVFNGYDTNHDNKLSTEDTWVKPTEDHKGIELLWGGSSLTIEHTTEIHPDWIV